MQKIFKKLFSAISYAGFFCSFSIILFVNLMLGFSYGGFDTKTEALTILLMSAVIAIGLPLIICCQHYKITRLVEAIDAVYKNVPDDLI